MNKQHSLTQRGVLNALTAIVGLGLLVVLAFSLNALFLSRTQQPPQTANQPKPISLLPSAPPTIVINQTNSTKEWKVYKNEEHGYTIKYPPTYFFTVWDTSKDPLRVHYISFVPEKYRGTPRAPEIGLVIYNNPEEISLREWLDQHTSNQPKGSSNRIVFEKIVDTKWVTVADTPALRFVEESPIWGTRAPTILVLDDKKIFKLFYTNAYSSEDLSQTFNLMLDTFQFTYK